MYLLEDGTDIIIWGCGYRGKWFAEKYKDRFNICYYVDNKVNQNEIDYMWDGHSVYNPVFLQKEDMDRYTIIIAIDKWEEVFFHLNNKKIKIFENCIPWEYVEYKAFDPGILHFISSKEEKKRIIRKFAKGRKICLPFGFCHLLVYKRLLMESNEFSKKYIFIDFLPLNSKDNILYEMLQEETIYSTCDIFLLGIIPNNLSFKLDMSITESIKKWIRSDCRIISITSATFKGYFPQHMEHRNSGCDENGIPIVQYFAWGDKNINKMFKMGLSSDEIIRKILDTDYYEAERCRKYFEHEFRILEKTEENCDVRIADYLRIICDKTIAYYSWTHPIPIVLIEITRRIALLLGIEDDFMRFKDKDFLLLDLNEEIVYPSVLKALGLQDEEYLYRKVRPGCMLFAGKRLSIEEYILKYIEYVLEGQIG